MARNTFENNGWIPEEQGSGVIQKVLAVSAVESLARKEPMSTDVKNFARSAGVDVESIAKGAAYGEDTSVNDSVTLEAKKIGKALRIAEEDLDDAQSVNIIETKKTDWASSYARYLDNATLGVTAAVGTNVPFTSVYKSLTTTDSGQGYTANANRIQTAGAVTYADLSDVLALVEGGDYWDEARAVIIAHPSFKSTLRGLLDSSNRPIFVDTAAGAGTPASLFGYEIRFSSGAKTNATASATPSGNPLLIVANADALILGVRSGPESVLIDGRDGASALTDETILKLRARRGFALASPKAAAVLEVTGA